MSRAQTGFSLLLLGGLLAAAPLLGFLDRRPGRSLPSSGFTIRAFVIGIVSVVCGVLLIAGVL
jgi:hypothetical protein